MSGNIKNIYSKPGWSGELQDLQNETIRLLHTIHGGSGSQQRQRSRQVLLGEGKMDVTFRSKTPCRRRKRRQVRRKLTDPARMEHISSRINSTRRFSHALDTFSGWTRRGTQSIVSDIGIGKTTVEVLDRGAATPRSTPSLPEPLPVAHQSHEGKKAPSNNSQAEMIPATDEDEYRFRSLTFKSEECRVRDGADTYVPAGGGLRQELLRLTAERDRLASIEEAQRETQQTTKRQQFLRFARREWLASDRAAESVQRVFRGYVGRKKANLTAEVRRIMRETSAEWVEVRDHNRGEAWYFNPTTGKSQWDRPASLLGTITPSEKIRTLPVLGLPPTRYKGHPPSLRDDAGDGLVSESTSASSSVDRVGFNTRTSAAKVLSSLNKLNPEDESSVMITEATYVESLGHDGLMQTAQALPALMKGTGHDVPCKSRGTGLAPYSDSAGVSTRFGAGMTRDSRGSGRQQTWKKEIEDDEEEEFPFLTGYPVSSNGSRMLLDNRLEETGLGLALKPEEHEEQFSWTSKGSGEPGDALGFFLADGTPDIRLRRTITEALRVTRFDSVSTLLPDYTSRRNAAAAREAASVSKNGSKATVPRLGTSATPVNESRTAEKEGHRQQTTQVATGGAAALDDDAPYPTGNLEQETNRSMFQSSVVGGQGRKMVSIMVGEGREVTNGVNTVGKKGAKFRDKVRKLKLGLAIRDLTPPGFVPPPEIKPESAHAVLGGKGNDGLRTSHNEARRNPSGNVVAGGDGSKQVSGEDDLKTPDKDIKEICFNCWSKGSGKTCMLHASTATDGKGLQGRGDGKAGEARAAESVLMCSNWDIGVMRRRYRSEELQEVFAKEASSVRYDKERKKFVSVVEQKHPIYRMLAKIIKGYNLTVRRKLHQKMWLRAFVEQLRIGKLQGVSAKDVRLSSKMLRLRNTLRNAGQVKAYTTTVKSAQPQGPITGSTLAERTGHVRVIEDRNSASTGRVTRLVLDDPVPVPRDLFEARRYHMPPAITIPMTEPKYPESNESKDLEATGESVPVDGDHYTSHRASWIPMFCDAAAGDIVDLAVQNVKTYTTTVKSAQPQGPTTESTLAERPGHVCVIEDRNSASTGRVTRLVLDDPVPVPRDLFEARRYHMPPAKTTPMAEPKYPKTNKSEDLATRESVSVDGGRYTSHRASWMPMFCNAAAGDIVDLAMQNVEVMSPVPGAEEMCRTKHPPPLTIKFAKFSRKPTPGLMAVGGLPGEMVVRMLVSTRTHPQYGNFTVMQKSSVAPTVSPEVSAAFKSLELPVENQPFLPRELQHPLNGRKAPTVMLKTLMADPENRHYFGLSRPEQTGEADNHGFRTSSHADAGSSLPNLDPRAFTPSEDVVTSNLCSANRTVTTHADKSYPFCEPSNRNNSTLDFYHLLLTATCSPNKAQIFTNLGVQECGEFMRESDSLRPLGHCVGVVYRSWAFLQNQVLEEFETDDGVPYWFDRRTGETFWERPLCEQEKVPVKEGGTVLGGEGELPDTSCGAFEEIKPRYDQRQMRRLMMKSHEDMEHLEKRRKQVATQVKWARSSGALPPPDLCDVEPPAQEPGASFHDLEQEEEENLSQEWRPNESGSQPYHNRFRDSRTGTGISSGNVPGACPVNRFQPLGRHSSPHPDKSRGDLGACGHGKGAVDHSDRYGLEGSQCKAERLAASIARALDNSILEEGRQLNPSDMLRFGMGVGITLGASGLLEDLEDDSGKSRPRTSGANIVEPPTVDEAPLGPLVAKITPNSHPIGHGHLEPTAQAKGATDVVLDHESEQKHVASILRDNASLRTSEEFKGLMVVPPDNPTPCPDEDYGLFNLEDPGVDPRRKAERSTPIIAYPEMLWKNRYRGHGAAGEGQSWIPLGGDSDRASNHRTKSSLGVPMRRTNDPLPEGFLSAITHAHVAKQHCDYLPHVPNMPQARAVGRIQPHSAAEDWFAVGFDPWSAGKEPLSAEFVPTLSIKQEDLGGSEHGARVGIVPQAGYLNLEDSAGQTEMAVVSAEEAKMAADFERISSWARHGHYSDIETTMNQADWSMPIDYQNDLGLTLLHVACQNDNKRVAKLCLRRGADVNKRSNNGQTALHFAYGFGFDTLGEYLISKGADDSITNAGGLTCYEGLTEAGMENL